MRDFLTQHARRFGKGSSGILCAVAVTLAGGGCLIPQDSALDLTDKFDQRIFRAPPPAKISPSPYRQPYWRYSKLAENTLARLHYCATVGQSAAEKSPPLFALDLGGESAWGGKVNLRAVEDGHVLTLTPPPRDDVTHVRLHWTDYNARTALLDPVTGKTFVLRLEEDGAYRIAFAPGQTWIVGFGEFARRMAFDGIYAVPYPRREVAKLDGTWTGARLDPNVLRLEPSGARYTVTVTDISTVCKLAIEQPEMYASVKVNGQAVTFSTNDFFLCETFQTGDVAAFLKHGSGNEIELVPHHDAFETSRSDAYLLGDFAVQMVDGFSIVKETPFSLGDIVPRGYPFYAGTFALETSVNIPALTRSARYLLTFPEFEAAVLRVIVNGFVYEPLFAPPWETDITLALRPGRNNVRVELTNDLNNLMTARSRKTPLGLFAPPVIVEIGRR